MPHPHPHPLVRRSPLAWRRAASEEDATEEGCYGLQCDRFLWHGGGFHRTVWRLSAPGESAAIGFHTHLSPPPPWRGRAIVPGDFPWLRFK
ncbi:unnamed protein product [Victoria cruziana]